jgi:hypothetical protein
MRGWRVKHPISDKAETDIPLTDDATNSFPRSKIPYLVASAILLVVVAVPILFRAGMPSAAANSTLKCYDNAGDYESCVNPANAPPSRFNGRTAGPDQPPSWTTTALYQQANWPSTAVDQAAIWPTTALDQPANSTMSADARRSSAPGKRPASATCERHLIPCLFSALRKGLTHIAAVTVGPARPAREHL